MAVMFAVIFGKVTQITGYNVSDISNYAKIKLLNKEFDEVYTEYRVKKYLER